MQQKSSEKYGIKLVLKTLNRYTRGHLRWVNNKPIQDQAFMLDGWEVRLYTIIPFLLNFKGHLTKVVVIMVGVTIYHN